MGVGTNVQARAIALHHLDCPWRPADLEQREGRILRQGNQNPEVSIYRYVVEGSFDAYSWQTVERKAKFIAQVMRGRLDVRELDDIGDNALSFAEVKAIAAGDPMILEKAAAETELTRLERLSRAHQRGHAILTHTIDSQTVVLRRTEDDLPHLTTAADTARSTAGDAFLATIGGITYTDRSAAADQLRRHLLHSIQAMPRPQQGTDLGAVADLGGHTVIAALPAHRPEQPSTVTLALRAVPRTDSAIEAEDLSKDGIGLIRHLERKVATLPTLIADVAGERDRAGTAIAEAQEQLGKPFKHAQQLDDARRRVATVYTAMTAASAATAEPPAVSRPGSSRDPRHVEEALAATRSPFNSSSPPAPGVAFDR